MRSNAIRGRTVRGIAVVACLALVAASAACSDDAPEGGGNAVDVPGVTASEILFGTHQPLTGPAAAGYSKISPATKAYFEWVNEKAGGVYGRKIKYQIEDDAYNPANTQQLVRKLVDEDKVFAILNGLGTPTHKGVLDLLKQSGAPDLFVASGATAWNQPDKYPGTFGFQPDYVVEGKIMADYVKKNYAGQNVCHLGQKDDFGEDSLKGVETVLGPLPADRKQTYVTSLQNLNTQYDAFKKAGCTVVISSTIPAFTARGLAAAAGLSYKPQFVVSSVGVDNLTLSGLLGANKGLLEGVVGPGYLPISVDDSNPWIQKFKEINKAKNGDAPFDNNVVFGMAVGYLTVQVLLKAGKDLTREKVLAAVEAGGFKGPGVGPFRYSKSDHGGYSGMQMGKISGGVQAAFGPVLVTDQGTGPVKESNDAVTAPPTNAIPTS